ncbi:MAG: gamma-glutamyl-gamma-aminobutyrate hydrolase family protein [Rhodospirillaceae bacterium]|jgi:putative glutamine amidotransferase|nr:gamma-glutamyl-gamma-aminobutyrate hydrolase family protein [Rhodospirillaceae bacterium]MBT5048917.1 gamma-glutamyl-gamma-aminobutyrate hydrolase family protein [Rhodospirillaceae bacterium]MBT5455790.1 gamma-glutamyl-gamma-aminobutyrate hydrolase family protein [Rhodospirillaceae bacterium]
MPKDSPAGPIPFVGVASSYSTDNPNRFPLHTTSDKYLRSAIHGSGVMPVAIPSLSDLLDVQVYAERLDGLLLPGGRANVEPHHYDGPDFPDDEVVDPGRDGTVLPLIRACVEHGVPVFGICRGIQEMNVALGGTLHYRLHLLPDKMDHRMRRDVDTQAEKMALRHPINLTPGGLLSELVGEEEVMVNSLHGQGIDRPADGFVVEAVSPDNVVEAVRLEGSKGLAIGVQWHAEWDIENHPLSRRLFEAFGDAARAHACAKGPVRIP